MSEREGPSSSGSRKPDNGDKDAKTPTQPVPTVSSGRFYEREPIQFRIRGTSLSGASPPKFVTLEDIMKAGHDMENMALAHEIAVDQNFKLEPFDPPDNSYQKLVKETMHKAYFDILRQELNSDPPIYKQALILIEDIKQGLFSVTLPRQTSIREMIEEALDVDFIKQQAEKNCLDFRKYADFVIDLMSKLAAPARDQMIQDITKLEDTVDIFRAILETLEVLKLDLANTLIAMIRPYVQRESVQYEKAKFDEMLKISEDGLQHTREWLKRHIDKSELTLPTTDPNIIKNVTAQTLAKAYLELLEWDDSKTYPETMSLDASRFSELGTRVYQLVCVASVILASPSCFRDPEDAAAHKRALKDKVFILLDNVSSDVELNAVLPSVAEEVVSETERLMELFNKGTMDADTKELIRNQVTSLRDPEHRVRQIVHKRVLEFLKMVLVCAGGCRQIPIGLTTLSEELTSISGSLLRYVLHNKAVFTEHYINIIAEELSKA